MSSLMSCSLASRLSLVQGEVERLSRSHSDTNSHETERLHRLRAEFSHLLRELRKRKSLECEPWDVQWRSRRRAMSCSFSRRPSMSVISLLSTTRPASVIETCAHPQPPTHTPLHSTIAYNDAPSTSVFNVNYSDTSTTPSLDYLSSPLCAPKNYSSIGCTENDNRTSSCGLYNEILSALESNEKLNSKHARCKSPPQINNSNTSRYRVVNDLPIRDHENNSYSLIAENSSKSKSNLRKYKSRTMTSIYDKSWNYRWKRHDGEGRRMSRSCNLLSGRYAQNYDYEVAIESLSEFATKIRRLSLENSSVERPIKNAGYNSEMSNFFCRQKKIIDKSRRHSTIALRKGPSPCHSQQQREEDHSPAPPSISVQPCIYEFV